MKTVKEIEAFVEAYAGVCGYVSGKEAESVTLMLAMGKDEAWIYKQVPEARTVIDAYYLWGAAREYQEEGGNIHEIP